ncbi:uncharacterized protein LOC106671012 [Cimex lectularius]|uniref:CHK kinase-like domain-containing protein n=1 Tax=Cimex lectularius TaxID=79782 RepID=A0A8I6S7G1_CIMLE|nr:uncharacterized protein LOC106671012 [Cimex lectularius]XP_024085365.1 uncharacterized protein LOC106671012 [Cimex lectularius]
MDANWFEAVLKKQEYENNTLRVVNVELEDAVPLGANYASIIKRAKLTVVLGSGRTVTKTVIIKQAHSGKELEVMLEFDVFRIETKLYCDVLSQMEVLLDQFNDRRGKMWCDMLGYVPYKTIVFSDLKNEGFTMVDRKIGQDENHAYLVLRCLGRFHAMSKVLLDKRIINDNDTNKNFLACDTKIVELMVKGGLTNVAKTMKEIWSGEWVKVAERVEAQIEVAQAKLTTIVHEKPDFKVLNHGDCWNCNLMFKYDESGQTPTSLRFLDFQVSHIHSYIWDIIYFLYSSVQNDVRKKHMTDFYKVYWESLRSNLEFFGFEGTPPTFDEVLKEAARVDYFAFFVVAVLRPFMMSKSDNVLDLQKYNDFEVAVNSVQTNAIESTIEDCADVFIAFMDRGTI